MPGSAQQERSISARAAVLRIKRGAKTLSQIGLARTKVVIGGGKTAQLRLKNAGLADECVLLDLRETPFTLVGLGADQVFVNGWAVRKTSVRPGDRIEFSGITLELLDPDGNVSESPAPVNGNGKGNGKAHGNGHAAARAPEEDDPYLGKETAARVLERAQLEARRLPVEEVGEPVRIPTPSEPARPDPVPPGRPVVPVASGPKAKPKPIGAVDEVSLVGQEMPRTGFSRPPWLEFVGEGAAAEARLYLLRNGMVAGRQGELRVQHASVSKKHARFEVREGRLFVEDQGSTNGVWVNRERVSGSREIKDGDTLHLGAVEFKIRIPDAAREELSNIGPASSRGDSDQFGAARPELRAPTEAFRPATVPPRVTSARSPAVPLGPGTAFDGRTGNGHARPADSDSDPDLELELEEPRGGRGVHDRGTERELPAARRDGATQRDIPAARLDRATERDMPAARGRHLDGATQRDIPAADLVARGLAPTAPRSGRPPGMGNGFDSVEARGREEEVDEEPDSPPPDPSLDRIRTGTRVHVPADAFEVPPPRMRERVGQVTGLTDIPEPQAPRRLGRIFGIGFALLLLSGLAAAGWFFRASLAGGLSGLSAQLKARLARVAPVGTPFPSNPTKPEPRAATAGGSASEPGRGARARGSGTRVASLDPSRGATAATPVAAATEVPPPTAAPTAAAKGDKLSDDDLWGISRPSPTPILRPGQGLLGDEKLDLSGNDKFDVASLEQDPAAKGLRSERTIGANELKSIFLDQGDAVVRLTHSDNWDLAPGDAGDASDRAVGARQVDPGKVNALIRVHFPEVKRCLVGGHFSGGKARVVVEFTLNPDGRASNIHVPESDVKGAGFQSCVVGVIKRIGFPRPKSQSVIVQFPFNFFYQ